MSYKELCSETLSIFGFWESQFLLLRCLLLEYVCYWNLFAIGICLLLEYVCYWNMFAIGMCLLLECVCYWNVFAIGMFAIEIFVVGTREACGRPGMGVRGAKPPDKVARKTNSLGGSKNGGCQYNAMNQNFPSLTCS